MLARVVSYSAACSTAAAAATEALTDKQARQQRNLVSYSAACPATAAAEREHNSGAIKHRQSLCNRCAIACMRAYECCGGGHAGVGCCCQLLLGSHAVPKSPAALHNQLLHIQLLLQPLQDRSCPRSAVRNTHTKPKQLLCSAYSNAVSKLTRCASTCSSSFCSCCNTSSWSAMRCCSTSARAACLLSTSTCGAT
jgi:hypothetical protein